MPEGIRAVFLDLDGVLYIGDDPIDGAAEAVARLRAAGLKLAGLTNTTTQSRRQIAEKLARLGIPLSEKDLFTPAALARARIGRRRVRLFVRDALREDFAGIQEDAAHPEVVVMGDIGGEGYPPEALREIFLAVLDGAELIALHKNRFWKKPDGLHLDLGAFVAAIEYATGVEATVVGKPARAFFLGVCQALGVSPEEALMVGDDIESDILGAHKAGLKTALVHTGKYRADFAERVMRAHAFRPDLELASIAELG
ncbi:MAG: TIGR01458 family HAD-type hydrolase [Zetaproteobacteria bacterium]|nr:MAG: TIGR01458 family HAD-type hydrolase [Zetaproteobacteria bacterium]